jgi:hypothetical protein
MSINLLECDNGRKAHLATTGTARAATRTLPSRPAAPTPLLVRAAAIDVRQGHRDGVHPPARESKARRKVQKVWIVSARYDDNVALGDHLRGSVLAPVSGLRCGAGADQKISRPNRGDQRVLQSGIDDLMNSQVNAMR